MLVIDGNQCKSCELRAMSCEYVDSQFMARSSQFIAHIFFYNGAVALNWFLTGQKPGVGTLTPLVLPLCLLSAPK